MPPCTEPRHISLSWKLTGFFVVFGLALAFFSFIAFGGASTRIVLRVAVGMAGTAFESAFPNRDSSFARSLEGSPNTVISGVVSKLSFVSHLNLLSEFRLYSRISGGPWVSFAEGEDGRLRSSLVGERVSSLLDKSEEGKASLSPHAPRWKKESVPAFLGLPQGSDGTRWVAGVNVDASGLVEFLEDNSKETVFFAFCLLALSLLLGRFFAMRFTKPLRHLAAAAEVYGQKDSAPSFSSGRRDEIGVLSRTLEGMTQEIERRRADTEERLRTMEAMNRIDKAVLSTASRSELLARVASIVNGRLSALSVAVALRNETHSGWVIAALTGDNAENEKALVEGEARFRPLIDDDFIDAETNLRITGYYEAPVSAAPPGFVFFAYDVMGAKGGRIVAAPLYVDSRYLGSLVIALAQDDPLSPALRREVSMLADQTAVALRSILEYEAKEENFLGILQSLTRAIDAKSRWTAGHSERVAQTAVQLGLRLQMTEAELRSLRISAILHDAGKLGVREAILDKPGKLEPAEYEEIKAHPVLGGQILAGIRSFEEVVPAIVHHHERWDGAGYPDKLSGESIPLFSRIIAVADVWDAITDDRPYRAGFPPDQARRFMAEQSGLLFDPHLVRLFLN
ncbi:MAG: HD domain-containing phosphohydrolase [Treponemataceae bacterium]